jgi:hypothetical protein
MPGNPSDSPAPAAPLPADCCESAPLTKPADIFLEDAFFGTTALDASEIDAEFAREAAHRWTGVRE